MVWSLIYAVVFYSLTFAMMVFGAWLLLGPRSWAIAALKLHGRICVWLLKNICGTGLEVRGRDHLPAGACLVVAKHQSAWDTFGLLALFQDPAVVLKDELTWIPLYGWYIAKFEHIRVKRDRAAFALKTMVVDAKRCVDQGRQVLIFPEGTRAAPGAPADYKPGYLALYEGLGVPCVPIALNSGVFWPRRTLMRYPGTIIVEILPPVPAGLARRDVRGQVESAIETASLRLLQEAAPQTQRENKIRT
jgi:1-acyl-sn-glycerol-3-phosphate acyltransferase